MNVVPTLPVEKRDSTGRIQHLNSYALDFFKHGSDKAIEKENGFVKDILFKITVPWIFSINAVLHFFCPCPSLGLVPLSSSTRL